MGSHRVTQSARQSFFSRSHHAVIRVYDEAGNLIGTHGLETLNSPVGCLFSQAGGFPKISP
jgi:hypothetical protein